MESCAVEWVRKTGVILWLALTALDSVGKGQEASGMRERKRESGGEVRASSWQIPAMAMEVGTENGSEGDLAPFHLSLFSPLGSQVLQRLLSWHRVEDHVIQHGFADVLFAARQLSTALCHPATPPDQFLQFYVPFCHFLSLALQIARKRSQDSPAIFLSTEEMSALVLQGDQPSIIGEQKLPILQVILHNGPFVTSSPQHLQNMMKVVLWVMKTFLEVQSSRERQREKEVLKAMRVPEELEKESSNFASGVFQWVTLSLEGLLSLSQFPSSHKVEKEGGLLKRSKDLEDKTCSFAQKSMSTLIPQEDYHELSKALFACFKKLTLQDRLVFQPKMISIMRAIVLQLHSKVFAIDLENQILHILQEKFT